MSLEREEPLEERAYLLADDQGQPHPSHPEVGRPSGDMVGEEPGGLPSCGRPQAEHQARRITPLGRVRSSGWQKTWLLCRNRRAFAAPLPGAAPARAREFLAHASFGTWTRSSDCSKLAGSRSHRVIPPGRRWISQRRPAGHAPTWREGCFPCHRPTDSPSCSANWGSRSRLPFRRRPYHRRLCPYNTSYGPWPLRPEEPRSRPAQKVKVFLSSLGSILNIVRKANAKK